MLIFSQLKQQLSQQLAQCQPMQGVRQLTAKVCLNAENSPNDQTLLGWLANQPHFPHYFWQSRQQNPTLIAVGSVRSFTDLDVAQQFSQTTGFQLVGGLQFEGACHFILPRLLLVKQTQQLTAYFTLDSDHFAEEIAQCQQLLQTLSEITPLVSSAYALKHRQSVAQFDDWQLQIEQALQQIESQQFNKVVLANAINLHFEQAINPYQLLLASQQQNLGCYHFLWAETASQAFIGSSPECLYQRQQQQLFTEALAGTVAVEADATQTDRNALWLLSDEKNRYENQLVVEDICQHLADCTANIKVGEAEIKRLHNVQHLRRAITATLKNEVSDQDCLTRIHPTAAVAGLPRQTAMAFIHQAERFERQWYAGTLGYFQPEQAEFCVTIRSAQICHNQITLYAGAGIVSGSTPQAEWAEIERKAWGLERLLQG